MSKVVSKSVAGVIAIAVLSAVAPATQSKFTLKVHTGRGQVGYDVNYDDHRRAGHGGDRPAVLAQRGAQARGRDSRVEEASDDGLFDASASGSPLRICR